MRGASRELNGPDSQAEVVESHRTQPWRRSPLSLPVITLLVFLNLFNPFSPFLTVAANLLAFLWVFVKNRGHSAVTAPMVIALAAAIVCWLFLVVIMRGDGDPQVVLKYIRTTTAVFLLAALFGSAEVRANHLVIAMNLAFVFHFVLISTQLIWPEFTLITAPIFGFERETSILEEYSLRKLGASSSYDTASLFSIAGLLFFCIQFLRKSSLILFLAILAAFLLSLLSSRTGMAFAVLVIIGFFMRLAIVSTTTWRLVSLFVLVIVGAAAYTILGPLFLYSFGLSETQSNDLGLIYAVTDYGSTGTLEALTGDHLSPMNRPLSDLLLGFAVDPNSVGQHSDIGYVKFVYHFGFVGLSLVALLHLYMFFVLARGARRHDHPQSIQTLVWFLLVFLTILVLFNYKSLEIYSRGTGDFVLLLFLYLFGKLRQRASPAQNSSRQHQEAV